MTSLVERVLQSNDLLGECPLWDEREQALWWVDIHGRAIKRYDGKLAVFPTPEPVGSIAFREEGGLLAAMQSGIFAFDDGKLRLLLENPEPLQRFNDGRC